MILAAKKINYSASEAASAVNKLMRLDTADTGALLEVLSEYFHPPSHQLDTESDSDYSDADLDDCDPPPVPNKDPSPMDEGT